MLKRYPGMKCVVPHFCADEFERCFALMDEYKNLYTDNTMVFSGFFPEVPGPEFFLKHLVRHQDRILYGTDFPNIPYQVETELNQILGLPLESEAKEKILRGNAIRLFGLEQLNDKEEP
jgi:predicted TIM-barrel fold metal-dependent hydrolase